MTWDLIRGLAAVLLAIDTVAIGILATRVGPQLAHSLRMLSKEERRKGGRPPREASAVERSLFWLLVVLLVPLGLVASFSTPPGRATGQPLSSPVSPAAVTVAANHTAEPSPSQSAPTPHTAIAQSTPQPRPTASLPTRTPSPTESEQATPEPTSVAISEVMFNPCQEINPSSAEDPSEKLDEYVEIYNYGLDPVNLEHYWITDDHPQKIVPWLVRYPDDPDMPGTETISDWVLPSHAYGVIFSPSYITSHKRPYDHMLPKGTYIYTVDNDRFLCATTCVGYGEGRDMLVLYRALGDGTLAVVSTYGTPELAPGDKLRDPTYLLNNSDQYPVPQPSCVSLERFKLSAPDNEFNWVPVQGGSPGFHATTSPSPAP